MFSRLLDNLSQDDTYWLILWGIVALTFSTLVISLCVVSYHQTTEIANAKDCETKVLISRVGDISAQLHMCKAIK